MKTNIKVNTLSVRLSDKRMNKIKALALDKEKSLTQLVENWIDTMPDITSTETTT